MTHVMSSAITNLSAAEKSTRMAAASEICGQGRGLADRAVSRWWEDAELAELLFCSKPIVTVGVAVRRETFARIRAANGQPELAIVPQEQDAEEFELLLVIAIEITKHEVIRTVRVLFPTLENRSNVLSQVVMDRLSVS